jgi:UDP-N-acetylglucosamine 1-carboxyvinyltransferase
MDKLVIDGGVSLRGEVQAFGAKNAALPLLAATLLTDEPCTLTNTPNLSDVRTMMNILNGLGLECSRSDDGVVNTTVTDNTAVVAPYDLVRTMRASICVLGPLLAKRKMAKVSYPGGCVIGVRPIDLHIKGLKALGANIRVEHGYVIAEADRLKGTEIYLGGAFGSSVTGTANVLCAAVLAEGRTVIECAAAEPEVQNLCHVLNAMGADISGIGSNRLVINGVETLHGFNQPVIGDRIEAATFLIAGAATRGDVKVTNINPEFFGSILDILRTIGISTERGDDWIRVLPANHFSPVDVTTLPYPGFPTDCQAQMMVLLTLARGISVMTEKIYPDRFMHVQELNRMGANIRKEGNAAIIQGVDRLSGAPVMASDLRASAALVIAGMTAVGTTEVLRVYHIDRGYERIEERLNALGARIHRVDDDGTHE